ncbi:MAG: hypothetical protein ACRC4O_01880 [Giesbergeria sp.]
MKSAFGIKLTCLSAREFYGTLPTGESVSFWLVKGQGWMGKLWCGGEAVTSGIASSSPQACYRSMRGQVANLRNALTRALERRA